MLAVATAVYGRVADLAGIRLPLLVGVGLMTGGAVLGAFAPSYEVLLGARLLQGWARPPCPTLGMAIVSARYDGAVRTRPRAGSPGRPPRSARWARWPAGSSPTSPAGAPSSRCRPSGCWSSRPCGGPSRREGTGARLDLLGAVLVAATAAGLVLLVQSPASGTVVATAGAVLLGLGVPAVAARVRRRPEGFLPMAVIREPVVVRSALAASAVPAAWFALLIAVPAVLAAEGWTPLQVGLALVPSAVTGFLAPRLAGPLLARLGPARSLVTSGITAAVALGVAALGAAAGSAPVLVTAVVLVTFAFGLGQPALMAAVGGAVPADVRGVALGHRHAGVPGRRRRRLRRRRRHRRGRSASTAACSCSRCCRSRAAWRWSARSGPSASAPDRSGPRDAARLASPVMRPTDLALLRTPGVPTVSPDGRMAVVAVTRLDLEADEYRSQLWAVPTDGSAPARPITSGHRDTAPAFSPDGRWLAFLGAEPRRPAAGLPAADGRRAAAPADRPPPRVPVRRSGRRTPAGWPTSPGCPSRAGTAPSRASAPGAEPPRLITTLQYRLDDVGFLADRRSQVFVLDLPADFADDTAPPAGAGAGHHRRRRLRGRHLAPGRQRAGLRLRPPRARRPRPGARRLRRRPGRLGPAAGDRVARRLRAARLRPGRTTLVVTAVPDLGPDGLDFVGPAGRCRAGSTPPAGALEPLLDPEQHHRGDETPGDRRRRRRRARRASSGAARWSCCACRWTAATRRCWSTARSPSAAFAAGGGVVVAVVAHDRSAGELIALTPGRRRLLTALRPAARRDRPACTGCGSGRRRRRTATRCTAG